MSHGNESDEIKRKVLQKFEGIAYGIALETGLPAEYAWTNDIIPKTWREERGIHTTEEGEGSMSVRCRDRNTAESYGVELERYCHCNANHNEYVNSRTKTEVVKEMEVETVVNKGQFGSSCTAASENDHDYRRKSREIESIEKVTVGEGKKIIEQQELDDELIYSDDDSDPFPVLLLEEKENSHHHLTPSPIPVQYSESADEEDEVVTPWFKPVEPALYVSEEYLNQDDESFSQEETEVSATCNSTEQPPPPPEQFLQEELQLVRHALCTRISMLKNHRYRQQDNI